MYKLLIIFLLPFNSFAFTLTTSPPTKFSANEITVNVSSDSCASAGMTNSVLLDMVEEAAEEYWNRVTTANIKIIKGSIVSTTLNSMTSIGQAASTTSPNTIIVGCSTNTTLFPSPSSDSTLGVGGIGNYSDGPKGAFLVNANGNFINQGQSEKTAVIAHELGHALGLGHSSDEVALMYYSVGAKTQERLTMDDKDGLTYLYPNEDKLPASCGAITHNKDRGLFSLSLIGLMMMALLYLKKKRPSFEGLNSY
ncbi:matrixin family metalloprotease [Halobacteriovorax sp.]|uniref:matrixin family metalloprotease n=1 Tax=Halobacteriovorax sp. TaxID=2020862 RepID=UPI003561A9AB